MGRFGNTLLVNGEPRWEARARRGEVVRFFLTNVSSTRVFNLSFRGGARMKVVASDLGRFEREAWVENVTIAPAERYVVDVRFEQAGEVSLVNRVRAIDHIMARFFEDTHVLGVVRVQPDAASPDHSASFARLRSNAGVTAELDRYRKDFGRPVDRELVVTLQAGDLPFPLRPLLNFESVYRNPVEWSGTMPEMDWIVSGRTAQWLLREPSSGRTNMDITWRFRVGDVVKLRLVNDRSALHAMHHPDPHPRAAIPGAGDERRSKRASRVERYGASADGIRRRRAARGHQSRQMDAALSHRGAHRNGHANGVRGGTMSRTIVVLAVGADALRP